MELDPTTLSRSDAYRFLISTIIPRPIAWVSTQDADGNHNLAPFSFFGGVTANPPTLMLSVGRRNGERKDSGHNLINTGEAVVHLPSQNLADAMITSSADFEPDVDELALCGLTALPSLKIKPPRIAECPVALECVVSSHQEVGHAPMDMFLLEIVHAYLDDTVVTDGRLDPALFHGMGRMGGNEYCSTDEVFERARPTPDEAMSLCKDD